ncbi:MAG: CoA transferase [Dehalococcoidia bacterium]|jgi:crotonobetainyl-CoA:carnitine CoA-transferase CaiB-like acyl-CoA transferase|nr:CoA transferase [Dehalococcoidia bacterium]
MAAVSGTVAGALSELTVLDLSHHVAGAYTGKLLASFGADVIKVEAPGVGDGARKVGPFPDDIHNPETSALYLYLNTGKKGLTLDLASDEGAAVLKELAAQADVLIENFQPGVMESVGLDYATLSAINPRLVMASISNFGQDGPYRDYRADTMVAMALSGQMYVNGHPDREPLSSSGYQPSYQAALYTYSGIMAALLARDRDGTGQYIDISIQEAMASEHQFTLNGFTASGKIRMRAGNRYGSVHPTTILPCKANDGKPGLVALGISDPTQYVLLLQLLDMPELLDDPRFANPTLCANHHEEFNALVRPWFMEHTADEIVHALQDNRIPAAFVNEVDDVLEDPQYEYRGFWKKIDHPIAGTYRYAGLPYHMAEAPPVFGRANLLGEHTDEVLAGKLGYGPDRLEKLREGDVI